MITKMKESIETVNFYPQEFRNIPQQDNPAFGGEECLMIVKKYNDTKAVVLHIVPDPIEAVNHIAEFWHNERAAQYCKLLECMSSN